MIIGLISVIILVLIISLIIIKVKNKFNFIRLKINTAEEDISLYLDTKRQLLTKCRPIIKKELKLKQFLSELEGEYENLDCFALYNLLKNCYNELFKTIDDNEKLFKSERLMKLIDELNDNEENIIGAIKYYNDNVVEYNNMINSFPSNVVALFSRYKTLNLYSNEKREIFEILNQK